MRQNSNKIRHFAIIDIGSVAIRSEIYSVNTELDQFNSELIYSKSYLPKLGNLDSENKIAKSSLNQAMEYLREIKKIFSGFNCEKLKIVGTAVFRQAENSEAVIKELEKTILNKVDILSEIEEASFIALGISKFEKNLPPTYLLLDIGGRSSELTLVENHRTISSFSFPTGAIEIRHKHFLADRPTSKEIINSKNHIRSLLNPEITKFKDKSSILIGSSGTLRMIGRFFKLSNKEENLIPSSFIEQMFNQLIDNNNVEESMKIIALEKNRQELIFSGLLLANEFCRELNITNLQVTNYSLRHGILYDLVKGYF